MKTTQSIKLDRKILEEILKIYFKKYRSTEISSVSWDCEVRIEGYGMNEHEVNYFNGCEVITEVEV